MKFIRVTVSLAVLFIAAAAAVVFTGVVEVRDVQVNGLPEDLTGRTERIAREWLAERALGVRRGMLLPLVRTDVLAGTIADELPELTNIAVSVDSPHALMISAEERLPDGIWCHGNDCRFWDRSGTFWGNTVPSVGPLLLLVRDERNDVFENEELFPGILAAIDGLEPLGLQAKYVVLPDAEPGGIRISTDRGWDLLLDASGDVGDQLHTLDVFLADKASDSAFTPIYIDLRTPGRVYYR